MRVVKEETQEHYRALLATMTAIQSREGGAEAAAPEDAAAVMVHNRALLRNKRLMLAYMCVPRCSAFPCGCVWTTLRVLRMRGAALTRSLPYACAATRAWGASRRCGGRWAAGCRLTCPPRFRPPSATSSPPTTGAPRPHTHAYPCADVALCFMQAAGRVHGPRRGWPQPDAGPQPAQGPEGGGALPGGRRHHLHPRRRDHAAGAVGALHVAR